MNDAPPIDTINGASLQQPEHNNTMDLPSHDQQPPRGSDSNGVSNANNNNDNNMIGSAHLRPVFIGHLDYGCTVEDIEDLFIRPIRGMEPLAVDRVDLKRGYAFVFFQEARSQSDKDRLERYVDEINGMYVTTNHTSILT